MRRAVVTGGAGFIGSHLVDVLLSDGWDVTAVDNFDPFYPREVKERNIARHRHHASYRLVEMDIRDASALATLTGDVDVFVHLAAKAGVRPSIADPVAYQDVNVGGTQNVLEFCRKRGVTHVVFASSSSVYGINPRVPWSEEDHVLLPISPYASTKVSAELLGHVYSYLYGIRFLALRFFTVYGPRQRPDLAIHGFTRRMLSGSPIPVFGDGQTRRDYTYVADIVAGIRSAMQYTATSYEIINLGNQCTICLSELIQTLESTLGMRAQLDFQPEQPGDVPQTWADTSKAQALLGYQPCTHFEDGIAAFVDWYFEEQRAASIPGLPARKE